MEYEIKDGEQALFDDSTNPSLDDREDRVARPRGVPGRQADPVDRRRLQTGELIPEEEHQLA